MILNIEGMGCAHCVAKVSSALKEIGAEVISCEIGKVEIAPYENTAALYETIELIGFDLISIE